MNKSRVRLESHGICSIWKVATVNRGLMCVSIEGVLESCINHADSAVVTLGL